MYLLFQGLGTDESTLIEVLATRTNREIADIKNAYKEGLVITFFLSNIKPENFTVTLMVILQFVFSQTT